jgi:hypothetical protein
MWDGLQIHLGDIPHLKVGKGVYGERRSHPGEYKCNTLGIATVGHVARLRKDRRRALRILIWQFRPK